MESALAERVARVASYLRRWHALISCHTVEFYTENLWGDLIPPEIKREVEEETLETALDKFWACAERDEDSSPLGRFVSEAQAYHLRPDGQFCIGLKEALGSCSENEIDTASIDKFLSPKKDHEVERLMQLVVSLDGTHCVELGGGKGYLGEALARYYGMLSLTVDCDDVVLDGGERRVAKIKRVLPKTHTEEVNIHKFINTFVSEHTPLKELVAQHFPDDSSLSQHRKIVISGLHTCGDLGAASLRLFVSQQSHALCNVPCCYHLLTEAAERDGERLPANRSAGFPMSDHLQGFHLGRNARMLASQSIDKVAASRTLPSVGLHYRAVLQVILKKHVPDFNIPEGRLRGVAAKSGNFREYFHKSMTKLGLSIDVEPEAFEEKFSCGWKTLVMFYLLRLSLAQAIECLILLDRLLFLRSRGYEDAILVKIFDASHSPRCHAILAKR